MNYRREIDGLRALAVLPVILFHAGVDAFSGGFVGVDVFFVISGYLITTILLSELAHDRFSLWSFYERRARRILPALFLVMLVCIPLAWWLLLPNDMTAFAKSLVAVPFFASNFLFADESDYFATASELEPLLHTWSLAVEEQYYLLFPLFLMMCWQRGRRWLMTALVLMLLLSFLVAEWASQAKPEEAFYLLPARGWELLMGALTAFYLSQANRPQLSRHLSEAAGWLGLALISLAVFAYSKRTPFPGVYALAPTVGTCLIIVFATQQTLIGRFMGNRLFVAIGLISYSAYLWHQPLFAFARHGSLTEPSQAFLLMLSALSLMLAYLSWRFVETPCRSKARVSQRGIVMSAAVALTAILSFGVMGWTSGGFTSRFGADYAPIYAAKKDKNPRQSECFYAKKVFPAADDYCVLGQGKPSGLFLGDSHADALAHALSQHMAASGLALRSATYNSCPPIENIYRADKQERHQCYEINRQSFDYAYAHPEIEYVVLLARWPLYLEGTQFDNQEGGVEAGNGLVMDVVRAGVKQNSPADHRLGQVAQFHKASIERLIKAGKKVILIYPIPEVGFDVPDRLAKQRLLQQVGADTTSHDVYLERNKRVLSLFDSLGEHPNLVRVRPDQVFCDTTPGGRCHTVKGTEILYYDDDHLSNAGARLLADDVVKAMLHVRD